MREVTTDEGVLAMLAVNAAGHEVLTVGSIEMAGLKHLIPPSLKLTRFGETRSFGYMGTDPQDRVFVFCSGQTPPEAPELDPDIERFATD